MTTDSASRRAGRVEQHRIEQRRIERQNIRYRDFGLQAQAFKIDRETLEAFGGAVDSGEPGAARRDLRTFPPRRCAEVDDAHSGSRTQQASGQRGGCVLNPPFALAISFEVWDGNMRLQP